MAGHRPDSRATPSCDFFGRQLVVIADQDAALRPFRQFPEDPYEASVCHIRKARDLPSQGPALRCRLLVQEAHSAGDDAVLSHSLHLWNLIGSLHYRCAESMTLPCVVPKPCVNALLLSGDIGLGARPRYISFEAKGHLLLQKSFVDDGRSKAFASLRNLQIGPFPPGLVQLVRDGDFTAPVFLRSRSV